MHYCKKLLGDKKAHDAVLEQAIWPYQEFIVKLYKNSPITQNAQGNQLNNLRDLIINFKNLIPSLQQKLKLLKQALDPLIKTPKLHLISTLQKQTSIIV